MIIINPESNNRSFNLMTYSSDLCSFIEQKILV